MATSINVRLSDELEKKLNDTVKEVKKNTPIGAEVNNSTIVRGALEDFFKRIEDEKKGIVSISFNVNDMNENELNSLNEEMGKIFNMFADKSIEKTGIESLEHIRTEKETLKVIQQIEKVKAEKRLIK